MRLEQRLNTFFKDIRPLELHRPINFAECTLLSVLFFFISIPLLASWPLSGDGAELVVTSVQGGVLHPPGFPFQAWLNRIFSMIPFGTAAFRLSLLSLLGHTLAGLLILNLTRMLKLPKLASLFSACTFWFFPTVWSLGVQPEVFAWAHFFNAAILHESIRAMRSRSKLESDGFALWIGVLVGFSVAQHHLSATTLFAFAIPCLWMLGLTHRLVLRFRLLQAFKRLVLMGGGFVVTTFFLYLSLFLLRGDSIWPDWGKLETFRELLLHGLRSEYGTFSLSKIPGETRGVIVFLKELITSIWIPILFAPFGFIFFLKRKMGIYPAIILLFAALGGFALLFTSNMGGATSIAEAVLERFFGPVVIPLSVLAGAGLTYLIQKRKEYGLTFKHVAFFAIGFSLFGLSYQYSRVNASRDNTLEVFQAAIGVSLHPSGVYLGNSDTESFFGAKTSNGIRFPVELGVYNVPWYQSRVLPTLDARLVCPKNLREQGECKQFLKKRLHELYLAGTPIFSLKAKHLRDEGELKKKLMVRGMFYVAHPTHESEATWSTVTDALALCPLLERLGPLPARGHKITRELRGFFARSFYASRLYLESVQKEQEATLAKEISDSLRLGTHPQHWTSRCRALHARFKHLEGIGAKRTISSDQKKK